MAKSSLRDGAAFENWLRDPRSYPIALQFGGALAALVRYSHRIKQSELGATVNQAVEPLGIAVTVWVVDYQQRALRALPEPGTPARQSLIIDATIAGRAFGRV